MAVYKIFPDKDTFLFTEVPTGNAGYDEMIELGAYPIQEVGQTQRALLHFKDSEITNIINNKIGSTNSSNWTFLGLVGDLLKHRVRHLGYFKVNLHQAQLALITLPT